MNYFRSIERETQIAPILTEHVCRSCEFALRQNNHTYYLFRYIPMKHQDYETYMTGSLDVSKAKIGTFCAEKNISAVFSKIP